MRAPKAELYPLIGDLYALGYNLADIGRAVGLTRARVCEIVRDMNIQRPRMKSVDDLPQHIRERVIALRNLTTSTSTV